MPHPAPSRPLTRKELQEYVCGRISEALGKRSWRWLAREVGISHSTLNYEIRKHCIHLHTLLRIADVLHKDLMYFIP